MSERALEVALQREEPEERQRIRELPEDERSDEVSRILEEKIMDGADEETRKGAAGLLFREAARWGYCAPQNEESAELLLMLGEGFLRGEFPVEDGVIFMESDLESAYRAAYYAGECGSSEAKELMEEIEGAKAETM